MIYIGIILYLWILSCIHALWEIEIEGDAGWAVHLPTWRRNKFWRVFLGGKPLTGYHFWMIVILLFGFHNIYLFLPWTISSEFATLGTLCFYLLVEDVMWFVLNPSYTIKKFLYKDIPWHKDWFGVLPTCYWIGIMLGTLFFILSVYLK
jgi:ribose/xylose/arabinose/galactoside ABC-type transport system permease subunit